MFAALAEPPMSSPQPSQPAPPCPDAELVRRATAGDGRAFRAIFDRHAPPVRRFLRDLVRDPVAADEATQEVFVRAHRELDKLREPERVRSWLFGIARFVHLERCRALRRVRASEAFESEAEGGTERDEWIDRGPSPADALLGKEADRMLEGALAKLGDERRAALLLRLDHGLGYDDIATHMGWSIQKVKNEIHRGRRQLRAELAAYLGGRA